LRKVKVSAANSYGVVSSLILPENWGGAGSVLIESLPRLREISPFAMFLCCLLVLSIKISLVVQQYVFSILHLAVNLKIIIPLHFRHTHCSLLFEAGATIKEVQDRLCHIDMNTTMNIYAHVTEMKR
jgi:integrase